MGITVLWWRMLACCALWSGLVGTARAGAIPEYALKASYLFNFMVYTQWADNGTGGERPAALNLCVLGQDNFGAALNALEDKSVNGVRVSVTRLLGMSGIKKCHLLFVTEREVGNLPAINRFIGDAPILVVADTPDASEAAILLSLEGKRLVFDINLPRIKRSGLVLSSKVLQLARSTIN